METLWMVMDGGHHLFPFFRGHRFARRNSFGAKFSSCGAVVGWWEGIQSPLPKRGSSQCCGIFLKKVGLGLRGGWRGPTVKDPHPLGGFGFPPRYPSGYPRGGVGGLSSIFVVTCRNCVWSPKLTLKVAGGTPRAFRRKKSLDLLCIFSSFLWIWVVSFVLLSSSLSSHRRTPARSRGQHWRRRRGFHPLVFSLCCCSFHSSCVWWTLNATFWLLLPFFFEPGCNFQII